MRPVGGGHGSFGLLEARGWSLGRSIVAAGVAVASVVGSASGQEEVVRLVGEVRDFATEQPIPDASVRIVELGRVRLTDRNGFFAFDSVPAGEWTFEASALGYETNIETSPIGARSLLLIRLEPAPVELEGLYVSVMQQLTRRRLAVPSRVMAWGNDELDAAIAADIGSFVRTRGVAQFVRCGGETSDTDLPNCFVLKGRPARLVVFIDDIKQLAAVGTSTLWALDPRDLWSVEFLPECKQLRIYTERFMRLVEEGRVRLERMILC